MSMCHFVGACLPQHLLLRGQTW